MTEKISVKGMLGVLHCSAKGFSENKVMKLSGSLAYYTVFSMAPLLVVVMFVCGKIFGKEAVEGRIYGQLRNFMGSDTALQLQELVKDAAIDTTNKAAAITSIVALVIGATTVFAEIQDSINSIWGVKAKPRREWLKLLQDRFLSFSLIVSLGFILLVSLALSAIVESLSQKLQNAYPEMTVAVLYFINHALTLAISTVIFAIIFKVLPDAKIKLRDVILGAILTALLFMFGRLAISYYITKTSLGSIYGAAGSLAIVLIWAYYSSMILFFGAEFTKAYAIRYGSKIYPSDFAVTTKTIEIETGGISIQDVENKELEVTLMKP